MFAVGEYNIKITLTMDEKEAKYLKNMVQNYHGENIDDEPLDEKNIRLNFWDSLTEAGVKL